MEPVQLNKDGAPPEGAPRSVAGHASFSSITGLSFERTRVMGIVNVTPDSFTDGGETFSADKAIARGMTMIAHGADIIDVGGESTRPGATPVTEEEELARVLPVVTELANNGCCISIDTRHASVMTAAVGAGAKIINDVTALSGDPGSLRIAADSGAAIVLMHMLGEPGTMNEAPHYDDVVADVYAYLADRVSLCEAAGIARERIAVDPGIGFGKTAKQNFTLLENINEFNSLKCVLLVGVSRKFGSPKDPADRLRRSIEGARDAARKGVNIVRVHDVPETVAALCDLTS